MENILDQDENDPEVVRGIVEEITSGQVVDILTQEDYTKVDESGIIWEGI